VVRTTGNDRQVPEAVNRPGAAVLYGEVLGVPHLPTCVARGAQAGTDGDVTRRRARICGWLGWRRPRRGDPLPPAAGWIEARRGMGRDTVEGNMGCECAAV
jgi:hypothetical protein